MNNANIQSTPMQVHGSGQMRGTLIPYNVYVDRMHGLVRGEQYVVVDDQPNINHIHNTFIAPESTARPKPMVDFAPASITHHVNMQPVRKPIIYTDQQERISQFMKDGIA